MKKSYIILSMCTLALAACTVQESIEEGTLRTGKVDILFQGEAFAATKTEVGSKEGAAWPVLWTAGDRIGLYADNTAGTENADFQNAYADLFSASAGQNSGVFMMEEQPAVAAATPLVIYYPYDQVTTYADGVLKTAISTEQKQVKPGDSSHTGKYTFSWATATLPATREEGGEAVQDPVTFSLTHAAAYVRLVISSSVHSGMKIAGASLYCPDAALSGDIAVNPKTGEVTNTLPRHYVTVTVEQPETASGAQELWLTTLPADLTGKEAYVSVSFTDGTKNVTVPVKVALKDLQANAVNTITVSGVDAAANPFPWYQPEEPRFLAEGYAYGESNTFIVSADQPEITIDVKARGYFIGCEEAKYAQIIFANNLAGQYTISLNGKNNKVGDENYAEYVDITDNRLTIRVTKGSYAGWFGKVGLMNADKEFIWAFNVWYISTPIVSHTYKNGVVMDRNLGNGYTADYDAWHGVGMYCQWGRPFGFSWGSITYVKAPTSCTDLTVSAKNPDKFFYTDGVVLTKSDWWLGDWTGRRTDCKDDFWGNPNTTAEDGSPLKGTKSVFDPCPKGWMVVSPAILKEVRDGRETEFRQGAKMKWLIYKYDGVSEAYWPFSGLKWGSSAGNPNNQLDDILSYHSNSSYHGYDASDMYIYQLYYRTKDGEWKDSSSRAGGSSIRCMKDDDNR